jgi:hypothetical protein
LGNAPTLLLAHPNEMVLPHRLSVGLQNMIANAGPQGVGFSGGGNSTVINHHWGGISVQAGSGATGTDIGKAIQVHLSRYLRDNHTRT